MLYPTELLDLIIKSSSPNLHSALRPSRLSAGCAIQLSQQTSILELDAAAKVIFFSLRNNPFSMDVKIEASWKEVLQPEFEKPYFQQIVTFLKTEKLEQRVIYPQGSHIFNAFNKTPFHNIKAVLLGQDPYHGPGQAHGLCFSVQRGVPPPPSLVNIYKELLADLGCAIPGHGHLEQWATQGLLMLNASLTVRANEPMSHSKIGWAEFTDTVIKKVSELKENVVFILWGKFAQEKQVLIDETRHLVLKAAHPSPLSANAGFFGCRHFSRANEYLRQHDISPINWCIE
jgi:uracil-DNA glycosylase